MERLGRVTWPVGRDHDLGGVFSGRAQRELPRYKAYNLLFRPTGRGDLLNRPYLPQPFNVSTSSSASQLPCLEKSGEMQHGKERDDKCRDEDQG